MPLEAEPIFRLEKLSVSFPGAREPAVRDISLGIRAGECLGIVGESGSGKSLAFLAALGLAPPGAGVGGSARFRDVSLLDAPPPVLRGLRGGRIGMVFQNPMSSLTPHLSIGEQLVETLSAHAPADRRQGRARAAQLLSQVHLSEPASLLDRYPWQLSGGMRQRVMIAIALAGDPDLLIADEPTTALDVTTQAGILRLLLELKTTRRLALALISHDFGVIAGLADRVAVVRQGTVIETGTAREIFAAPRAAYTQMLLDAARSLEHAGTPGASTDGGGSADTGTNAGADTDTDTDAGADTDTDTGRGTGTGTGGGAGKGLRVRDLTVRFGRRARPVLDRISIDVPGGVTFGVLGESGSGKSTLMRAILRLLPAESGTVIWLGRDTGDLDARAVRRLRADMQLVFQDPLGSLDPLMRVAELIAEPLRIHRALTRQEERERVLLAMDDVQLDRTLAERFPGELSGGQCQRVGIARALVLEPSLLICDEPVSALDASVQVRIIELLRALQSRSRRTTLLVSHHLGIVRALCTSAAVLYRGQVMERGPVEALCTAPLHPYTRLLLDAIPLADPEVQRARLSARALPPERAEPPHPDGCVFRGRCPHAEVRCAHETPRADLAAAGHEVACLRWRELA